MVQIILVVFIAIITIIVWHKKINPDTTWIYVLYTLFVVTIYILSVLIALQR